MRLDAAVSLAAAYLNLAQAAPASRGLISDAEVGRDKASTITETLVLWKRGKPDGNREGMPPLEAASKEAHDGSPKGIFYRGDTRPPAVIFKEGFTPRGTDMNLDNHLNFKGESGYISVSRSRDEAIRYAFARQGEGVQKSYVYTIAPQNLHEGYWMPRLFPNKPDIVRADEYAVGGSIDPKSIQGVYDYQKTGSQEPVKTRFRRNGIFAFLTCRRKTKRAEGACVPAPDIMPSDPSSRPTPEEDEATRKPGSDEHAEKDRPKPETGDGDKKEPHKAPGVRPPSSGDSAKNPQTQPAPDDAEKEKAKKPQGSGDPGQKQRFSPKIPWEGFADWAQGFDTEAWKRIADSIAAGKATEQDYAMAIKKSMSDVLQEREFNFGSVDDGLKTLSHWAMDGASLARFQPPPGLMEDFVQKIVQNAELIHQGKTPEEKLAIANANISTIAQVWSKTPVGIFNEELMKQSAQGAGLVKAAISGIDEVWSYTPMGLIYHYLESKAEGFWNSIFGKRALEQQRKGNQSALVPSTAFEDCLVRQELECKGLVFDLDGFYKYQEVMIANYDESVKGIQDKPANADKCPTNMVSEQEGKTFDSNGKPQRLYKDCTPFTPNRRAP
ncbi:hypothetical protein HIM_00734 [Hirsutella minnesotensis 3608]|nr:hypothetical protein HIM_00734 [Hirsutella minnesotensis 3608]